jgi:periplasmic protein TonB
MTSWADRSGACDVRSRSVILLLLLIVLSACADERAIPLAPSSAATHATDAAESPAPAAAAPKVDGQRTPPPDEDDVGRWQRSVLARIQPFMHWPPTAPEWVRRAEVAVAITIDRKGRVLASRVITSSGYEVFDHSAARIYKRAQSLPPPPSELKGDPFTFEMTITFDQFRKPPPEP